MIAALIASLVWCGTYMQDRKVLRDVAVQLPLRATQTTIAELLELLEPRRGKGRHRATERAGPPRLVEFGGALVAVKHERDGDLHVVIREPHGWRTLIAEFPSSACTYGSPYRRAMTDAREEFLRLTSHFRRGRRGKQVIVFTGVLFFDKPHKQRGSADNGIEIHPVLRVSARSSPPNSLDNH